MIHCTSYSVANFVEFIVNYEKIFEVIQVCAKLSMYI